MSYLEKLADKSCLVNEHRLVAATEEMSSPEVLATTLWLLRVMNNRGVAVVAMLELMTEAMKTGEPDQEELERLLREMP